MALSTFSVWSDGRDPWSPLRATGVPQEGEHPRSGGQIFLEGIRIRAVNRVADLRGEMSMVSDCREPKRCQFRLACSARRIIPPRLARGILPIESLEGPLNLVASPSSASVGLQARHTWLWHFGTALD